MLGLNFRSISESIRSYRNALMVQIQSMGLWEGKQFRMYRTFTVAQQFQFVATKDFILQKQSLYCGTGSVQVQIMTGATPSGVYTDIATQTGKNRLGNVTYVQANKVQAGGTFTGGTEREVIRSDSGVGTGVAYTNVDDNARVLPAGTYYFNLTVTGTTAGIYAFEWEELSSVNGVI